VTRARGQTEVPRDQVPRDRADQAGEDDVEPDRADVHDPACDGRRDLERDEGADEIEIAALTTAARGESARVETDVAIEFGCRGSRS
jgi:hypothetical protein